MDLSVLYRKNAHYVWGVAAILIAVYLAVKAVFLIPTAFGHLLALTAIFGLLFAADWKLEIHIFQSHTSHLIAAFAAAVISLWLIGGHGLVGNIIMFVVDFGSVMVVLAIAAYACASEAVIAELWGDVVAGRASVGEVARRAASGARSAMGESYSHTAAAARDAHREIDERFRKPPPAAPAA